VLNRTAAGLSPVRAGAAAAGNEEGKRVRAGRMVAARGNVGFVPAWIRNANVVLGAQMSGGPGWFGGWRLVPEKAQTMTSAVPVSRMLQRKH
jgi:hypothetical protein